MMHKDETIWGSSGVGASSRVLQHKDRWYCKEYEKIRLNIFFFFATGPAVMGKSAFDPHVYVWVPVKGGYPYYEGPYTRQ